MKPILTAKCATLLLTAASLFLGAQEQAWASPLSAKEISARALKAFYYQGTDMRMRVSMVLTNANGRKRRRKMTMLRKNFGDRGDQRYFVFFRKPADVKGMTFMVWKYPTKADDRWIFLPAIKLVRRISANDKRSSFVGSDFTYEDVSGRDVGDERHKLLRSEKLGGRPCFVVESRPKGSSDYARRVSWIDKQRWMPLKEEYFDGRKKKIRVFMADEVQQVGDRWTVTKRTMKNLQTGHRTAVKLERVGYDVGLPDDLFTERSLRRPPRRWIK